MEHLAGQYFLNSDLREEEIREQIGLLCKAGYESIFLHARAGLKTPYFSQEWFDALRTAIDELIRHGAGFSIWDEDNYPSGDAGNRICNEYPELASSYLNFRFAEGVKGRSVREFFSVNGAFAGCFALYADGSMEDLRAHCGTLREAWEKAWVQSSAYSPYPQLPYPHRRRSMNTPRFALVWTPDRDCRIVCAEWIHSGPGRHSSDLLNPETSRVFLEMIHEEYVKQLGPERMKHCASSFMDEPSPAGLYPWTRRFPEEFRKDHGYDLREKLPHLVMDVNGGSVRIRNDYRMTLSRLLCESYLDTVRTWLNAHGIKSTGHLTRSESLQYSNLAWPNELRCFKHLDIPCCDPLGAGIGQPGALAHHIGIKAVSSAARLFGKAAAGADAFAVGGDTISLRDLKFMLNYHLVLGITWYNVHGLYYTLEGERRDEAPPSLFYQHSQWPHMPEFLAYLKRRCGELTGEHLCNLEMLYPSTTLRSRLPGAEGPAEELHQTAEALLSHQRDFELIDEETLAEQDPKAFVSLRPYFLVAHARWIESATARWLEAYAAAGGTVFVTGLVPEILPELDGRSGGKWAFAEKRLDENFIEKIPAPELTGNHPENVLIRRVRGAGGENRTFLFNRGSGTFRGTLDGVALEIAPGEAGFAEELHVRADLPGLSLSGWKVTFGLNSVPLYLWEFNAQTNFDLLTKRSPGISDCPESGEYYAVFTLDEVPEKLLFTTEEDSLARGAFSVNGTPLSGWRKADFRDCRERECDISSLVRPGRNEIRFQGTRFENAPFLRGRFKAAFPLGNCGYPVLSPAPEVWSPERPQDYRIPGYGTFSGTAVYECEAVADRAGRYALDLNLIFDSVRIFADNAEQGVLIAPPYRLELDLTQGRHTIRLEVCNAPGNRDVLAGLPAGLQG